MRCPPGGSDDATRRQFLRRVGGGLGAGGLASTAGCLGVRDELSPPPTAIGGTAATPENARSRDAFESYVADRREEYGEHGVWGVGGSEPDHGLDFAGAWTRRVGLGMDGSPKPDPESTDGLRAVADAAVAAYGIPREAGPDHYQLWLWAAGRVTTTGGDGVLAATPALRRVEVGVGLTGDEPELGPYTPGSDRSSGPIAIGPSSPGFNGPAASIPLESGVIRVVPERTGFDRNAYAARWEGDAGAARSVNATCEAAWGGEAAPAFDLSVRLAADRRRL